MQNLKEKYWGEKKLEGGPIFENVKFDDVIVISDDEILSKGVNPDLVHTSKISWENSESFKSYRKKTFRGGPVGPPPKMHEGLRKLLKELLSTILL